MSLQIDVKEGCKHPNLVECNLYTGERCVKIIMYYRDYENLILDGFFLRNGREQDSADVWNTTEVYEIPETRK